MLDEDQLVTVADVQGDHDTLRAAVEDEGWPDVDDLRDRFVFTLDDTSPKRDLYRAVHPDTRDRLIFVSAQPPDDDAAFTVVNDPVADGDLIRELVEQGYMVRTRTDADTRRGAHGRHHPPRGRLRQRGPDREHRLRAGGPALPGLRHRRSPATVPPAATPSAPHPAATTPSSKTASASAVASATDDD